MGEGEEGQGRSGTKKNWPVCWVRSWSDTRDVEDEMGGEIRYNRQPPDVRGRSGKKGINRDIILPPFWVGETEQEFHHFTAAPV